MLPLASNGRLYDLHMGICSIGVIQNDQQLLRIHDLTVFYILLFWLFIHGYFENETNEVISYLDTNMLYNDCIVFFEESQGCN